MDKPEQLSIIDKTIYYYQTPFIFVLNSIFKITGKLGEKVRNQIIKLLCFAFPAFFIVYYSGVSGSPTIVRAPYYAIIGSLLLLLLTILGINKKLVHIAWNPGIILPMIFAGIR